MSVLLRRVQASVFDPRILAFCINAAAVSALSTRAGATCAGCTDLVFVVTCDVSNLEQPIRTSAAQNTRQDKRKPTEFLNDLCIASPQKVDMVNGERGAWPQSRSAPGQDSGLPS